MSGAEVMLVLKVVGTGLAAKTAIEGIKEKNLFKAVLGGIGAYFGVSSIASQVATGSAAAAGTTASTLAPKGAAAVAGTAGGAAAAPATTIGQAAGGGIGALAPGAWEGVNLAGMTPAASGFGSALNAPGAGLLTSPLSGAALGAVNATAPLASLPGSLTAAGQASFSGLLGPPGSLAPAPTGVSPPADPFAGMQSPGGTKGLLAGSPEAARDSAFSQARDQVLQKVDESTKDMSNFSIGAVKKWAEDNPSLAASLLQIGGSTLYGFATAQQRENELQRILNLRAEERARRGAIPVASGTYNWNFS
jgi:hypothetical protein